MNEISVFDDAIYGLLETIYELNYKRWYQTILSMLIKQELSYKQIREELNEVPEILLYRCLEELVQGQVIRKSGNRTKRLYGLAQSSSYLQGLLQELEVL